MGQYLSVPSLNSTTVVPANTTTTVTSTETNTPIESCTLASVAVSGPALIIKPPVTLTVAVTEEPKLNVVEEKPAVEEEPKPTTEEIQPVTIDEPKPTPVEEKPIIIEEPKPIAIEEVQPVSAAEEKILEVPLPTGPKSAKKKGKKHRN